jgi:hypothetical protein
MQLTTNRLRNIRHPLVSSVHMRKDFAPNHRAEDVLVIETSFPEAERGKKSFDSYLLDLLVDLKDLKSRAETQVGKFDRVDIRLH